MISKESILKFKLDVIFILLLAFTLPLFFYKLGQSSLVSFDEAWYGDISRNILKHKQIFDLYWNGAYYTDHPPAGFWLTAVFQKILGISDFSARAAQASAGFLTLILIYLFGKELFNRIVGFASAIALASSPWFLFRARSGNLDISLTMFFILTLLLALKAAKDRKYLIPFSISFSLLLLSKTIVPFTIIPALLIIFWKSKNIKLKNLIAPSLIILFLVGSWFVAVFDNHDHFFQRYLQIGLPGVKTETSFFDNLKLMKEYLHNGIGKWFWPGILAIFLGPFLRQKRFFILTIFFLSFFLPFLTSNKGHIWHLIPAHPIMILAFIGFMYIVMDKVLNLKVNNNFKTLGIISFIFIIVGYHSFIQMRRIWYEFVDINPFISDEAILSKEAGKYPQKFYMDGDFGPTAVYYSEKKVEQIRNDRLKQLFDTEEEFILITGNWRLEAEKIPENKYKIIKRDRDKVLLLRML